MSDSVVEAYDLARFAEQLEGRLTQAAERLEAQEAPAHERGWMETARSLVSEQLAPVRGLLDRARLLPELSFLREEVAEELLDAWVDALEKLQAGITFHAGSRAPVIEALFPHKLKLSALRRASKETALAVSNDLERRLKTSYVTRILGQEEMAFAQGVLELIRGTFAQYLATFDGAGLPAEEAGPLRRQLLAALPKLELTTRQSKLLAEAALLSCPGAFEECGLALKPKRRAQRSEARVEGARAPELTELESELAAEAAPTEREGTRGDLASSEPQGAADVSDGPQAEAEVDPAAADAPPAPTASAQPEAATEAAQASAPARKSRREKAGEGAQEEGGRRGRRERSPKTPSAQA